MPIYIQNSTDFNRWGGGLQHWSERMNPSESLQQGGNRRWKIGHQPSTVSGVERIAFIRFVEMQYKIYKLPDTDRKSDMLSADDTQLGARLVIQHTTTRVACKNSPGSNKPKNSYPG